MLKFIYINEFLSTHTYEIMSHSYVCLQHCSKKYWNVLKINMFHHLQKSSSYWIPIEKHSKQTLAIPSRNCPTCFKQSSLHLLELLKMDLTLPRCFMFVDICAFFDSTVVLVKVACNNVSPKTTGNYIRTTKRMCWWCLDGVLVMSEWCLGDIWIRFWWCLDDVLVICCWCYSDVLIIR